MLPLRVVWSSTRRNSSLAPNSLDSFISSLSNTHKTERIVKSSGEELEKTIDEKRSSSMDRLRYILELPPQLRKHQLSRIRDDSFATDFSSTKFKSDDLIIAIDKMCKLQATDTQTYGALMTALSSISPSSLLNSSTPSLVEVVSTNEELNTIDNEEWKTEAKKIVAQSIKQSTTSSDVIGALNRTNLWKNECIENIKTNFKSMSFSDKVSLLISLSGRPDVDKIFVNTMVEEIASDKTPLTFRQCIKLALTCKTLKLTSSRLTTKLINEIIAGMGSMTKWGDARTIVTLCAIWRVTNDTLWKQLSLWTERRANDPDIFKDLATVVNIMADLGRSEGSSTASILSERMCMEKGGDALMWLKTMVSLSFYSTIDYRSIESVLNTVFIEEILRNCEDKRSLILRLLMQVDYYASTLESYNGPRLPEGLITNDDKQSIISSYNSRIAEVEAFRSCLSRVIVNPAHCHPQLHSSGLTLEALFKNDKGGEEAVVFVPSIFVSKDGDKERMMGSHLLSVRCLKKKGINVHSFTHQEMESFSHSQTEATKYIKKKILGK